MTTTTLTHDEARQVYDRIGSFQDSQAFYEDRTTAELLAHGEFESATAVFEFGCGTGRFATKLLGRMPESATYRGVDLSPTMTSLATERLAPWGARAEAARSDGGPPTDEPAAAFDRWVSTFVFDLLSEDDIDRVLAEAHRMLKPGGLLCLAGLSPGQGGIGRLVAAVWSALHRLSPRLVGGCRPLEMRPRLQAPRWEIVHYAARAPFGVPSEAVVARRLP